MTENFDPMFPFTITLAVALAVVAFFLGRSTLAFGRLRRISRRAGARAKHAEEETRVFRGAFLSIQNPSLTPLRYEVSSTGISEFTVFMCKPLPEVSRPSGDICVYIPIKTFCDADPDFARREALEFAEICRQN